MTWQQEYLERFYRSKPGWTDGTTEFFELVAAHVDRSATVLELGPGPSNPCSRFFAQSFAAVDGLDVDPACSGNEHLRKVWIYEGGELPIASASYDAVVSNCVLEHIADPVTTLREIGRVLKPGGVFAFRTPNRWHYVSLVALLTPQWFHDLVANRLRNLPDEAHEPYPTYYRMNTARLLTSQLDAAGFEALELRAIEKEPSYGMSNRALFRSFMLYERLVNSTERLAPLRANILGAFRKRSG